MHHCRLLFSVLLLHRIASWRENLLEGGVIKCALGWRDFQQIYFYKYAIFSQERTWRIWSTVWVLSKAYKSFFMIFSSGDYNSGLYWENIWRQLDIRHYNRSILCRREITPFVDSFKNFNLQLLRNVTWNSSKQTLCKHSIRKVQETISWTHSFVNSSSPWDLWRNMKRVQSNSRHLFVCSVNACLFISAVQLIHNVSSNKLVS